MNHATPNDLERELLGALVVAKAQRPELVTWAFATLHERDFNEPENRLLWNELRTMTEPWEHTTVLVDALKRSGGWARLEKVLGKRNVLGWLTAACEECGLPGHVPWYCQRLRELRKARARKYIGTRLVELAEDKEAWHAEGKRLVAELGKIPDVQALEEKTAAVVEGKPELKVVAGEVA